MSRILIAITVGLLPNLASAQQQVTIQTPFQSTRDSFFENFGFGGNFNFGNGVVATFNNNQNAGIPPFGGFTPGAGISSGMRINGGNGVSAGFNFNFSQGGSRSFVSQTPVITGMQGYPMFLRSGVQVPFVTGFTPIVGPGILPLGGFGGGGLFSVPTPSLRERWEQARSQGLREPKQESAAGGLQMRAEPRAQQDGGLQLADALPPTRSERLRGSQAQAGVVNVIAQDYFEKGEQAEADGKAGVAKIYYRMAAKRASGEFLNRITAKLKQLD